VTKESDQSGMSIPLSRILVLSHDLYLGRKRQAEWEASPEQTSRNKADTHADAPQSDSPAASCPSVADDVAEIKFLRESLGSQGIVPRAPATETALLRLWSASPPFSPIQGSDLNWMACLDQCFDSPETATPVCAQGEFECLSPVKDNPPSANGNFCKLLSLSSFGEERPTLALPSRADMNVDLNASSKRSAVLRSTFVSPLDLSDVKAETLKLAHVEHIVCKPRLPDRLVQPRLHEAIDRLRALVRKNVQDLVQESDTEEEEAAETLKLVQKMSREAMLEAERQELSQLLEAERQELSQPLEAVSCHCVM
jgi:hypothetical protein